MAEFVMTCPDCNAPLIVNTWFFSKRKVKCECGKVVIATKIAEEACPECGNTVVYDRSKTYKPQCQICNYVIDVRARNMKAINEHSEKTFLTVDLTEIFKKKDEVAYFEENETLAVLADQRVELAMSYDDEETAAMSLFASFGGAAGKLGDGTDNYNYILNALYRYYKNNPDERVEKIYQRTLNLTASLALSDNIKSIQSLIEFLTPEVAAEWLFNMVMSEMYYRNGEVSPFESIDLKDLVEYYLDGIKNDVEFYADIEVLDKIREYVKILQERYEMDIVGI